MSVTYQAPPAVMGAKPLLKWAGGKTQLLQALAGKVPDRYGTYIEPFFGGGALFFRLQPENAVISDSNPELMNLYQAVADEVEQVIAFLSKYEPTEEVFYAVRQQDWTQLSRAEAAARTIFLNKTCYNGLYRVNRKGQFNVPFGQHKNPRFLDEEALIAGSTLLSRAKVVCGDYKDVLHKHAKPGDFVYLDPPYIPISQYSDFKRYTKEQFYEENHRELAEEVKRLHDLGCWVVVTNSNHPLVLELYKQFEIEVVATKRHISCNGKGRNGEDVIVTVLPKRRVQSPVTLSPLSPQVSKYPSTRFMGSKNKLLQEIWNVASQFDFSTAIDLFSGSGAVSYMFKCQGKKVISNDYMAMCATLAKATVENNSCRLSAIEVGELLTPNRPVDRFVQDNFQGLYFSDEENQLIDILRANIKALSNPHKRALAMAALIRACVKKRPRGIFTFVGNRYDDGRRDLKLSLRQQFCEAADLINNSVFDNGQGNSAVWSDALEFKAEEVGLVYIDPPYYSPFSDNEYVRRYHFVEGLARDWQGVELQANTVTKKFKSYSTPFSSKDGAATAFDQLFRRFKESFLVVSYSSNSLPTKEEMIALMQRHKHRVEAVAIDHKYSFGTHGHKVNNGRNDVKEYLFVGY